MSKIDQATRIAAFNSPLGANTLVLRGCSITETISRLPSFELDLISEEETIDPRTLLGKPASVRLNLANGNRRFFHGYIVQFSRSSVKDRYYAYRATVVPWLWFLTRTADCRIFQNQSVPDIVKKIVQEHDFEMEMQLSGNYTPWEYCVQYRESDFNFISRLLEQEGISYYFRYEENKNVLVLNDAMTGFPSFPGYDQISYLAPGQHGMNRDREHVREVLSQMNHISGGYVHTDYDFEKPNSPLQTRSDIQGPIARPAMEVFDYPGEYVVHSDGQDWARVRMEEIHAQIQTITGWADARGLAAGHVFTLTDPPHREQGGKYLLTSIRHTFRTNEYESGREDEGIVYAAQFIAQPTEKEFRPPRVTPKPKVGGIQTAIVVGPKGEEIHTDKYGRIKVQFHWDRLGKKDDNSSCWIRVAQIWAGRRWGALFTPRVGQEVVVDFLEGDPDQPLVTGSLYNGDQMPAYLGNGPDGKHAHDPKISGIKSNSTQGGDGYNELRFNDAKGKEQVFMHAQKDMDVRVRADERKSVGGSVHLTVGYEDDAGGLHGYVREKIYKTKVTETGENIDVYAGKKHSTFVGKSGICKQTIEDNGKMMTEVMDTFCVKAGMRLIIEAGMEISINCGASFIKLDAKGVSISGPMLFLNSGGSPTPADPVMFVKPEDPDRADSSKTGYPSNT